MRGAMAVPRKVHSNGRDWSGRKCGRKSRTAKNLQVRAGVLEYRSGHDRGDAELSRNSGSYRNPRQANEMLQKATDEAKELLQQSEQLAMEQTRLELIDSAITDEASGAAREAANMQRGHRAAEEVGGSASDKLAAFIAEQGVWHTRAHALACTLTEQNSPYASIDTLDAKLRLLRRALPGVDVPQLAARDAAVLSLPADSAVSRLLELTDVFSFNKLHKILLEVPSLLYLQDFKGKLQTCGDAIMKFYPTVSWRGVRRALEEEPSLLVDLPQLPINSWVQADIAELPMSTQNTLAYALRDWRSF